MTGGALPATRASGYALRALAVLAAEPSHGPLTIRTIARRERLPFAFLAKVAKRLVQAGILRSRSGVCGGLSLAKPPSRITLWQVLLVTHGSLLRTECFFYPERSCRGAACPLSCWVREEEERVRTALSRLTLDEVARTLGASFHGRTNNGVSRKA